jgi:uncharacterized protein YqhQ
LIRFFKHFFLNSISWALNSSNDDILVGGQAVIEGVMMRSPKGYSVAVRRQDGSFTVIKDLLKTVGEKHKLFKLPVFRGVGVLGQALVLGIKALQFSAEAAIADEEAKEKNAESGMRNADSGAQTAEVPTPHSEIRNPHSPKPSKWFIAGNLVVALGVNVLLFVVLPLFLTRMIQGQLGFESTILFNSIDGVFRVGVFVLFLFLVSQMKDMKRVFQYHGAEHKTVYNFEARETLKVENAKKFSTLHPRCGTSFLLIVMVVSIIVFSVVQFDSIYGKLLSRIILLPLVAGISYEIIRYSAKHPKSLLRWVTMPGLLLQKITTKEPDEPQLETAIRALEEALTV